MEEFLTEEYQEMNILTEGKEHQRKYYIEGITLQGNTPNGNGRIYPTQILTEAINAHTDKYLHVDRALGELGHPEKNKHKINYENACHKFVKVTQDNDAFITKAEVLTEFPKGKILKNLIDAKIGFGISSRAFGATKVSNGVRVVQGLRIVSLGDIEHEPSAPDAFMTAIMENHEWVYENGVLIGKDLNETLDEYHNIINKTPKSQLNNAYIDIFKDYFNKLK